MSVIVTSGFLLTSPDEVPSDRPRLCVNRVTGTVTASSEASGYPASRADNVFTYAGWKPTAVPATWEIDLGGAEETDYCGIVGQYNGASIAVQYYDGSWNTITEKIPKDDEPVVFLYEKKYGSKLRLYITGQIPIISVIKFGISSAVDRGMQTGFGPGSWNRQNEYVTKFSEGGQVIGRTKKRRGTKQKIMIPDIPESWADDNWDTLRENLENESVFFIWDPTNHPSHIIYGMTDKDPRLTYSRYGGYLNLDMELAGL